MPVLVRVGRIASGGGRAEAPASREQARPAPTIGRIIARYFGPRVDSLATRSFGLRPSAPQNSFRAFPMRSNQRRIVSTSFTDSEIAEHTKVLEDRFWSHRRPPVHLRDQVREGQRFTDRAIELFIVRPVFNRPDQQLEEPIARIQHMPRLRCWRIFWKRADGNWHRYQPNFEVESLTEALRVIDEDANGCFFG
jgi:hypothetical protein